MKKKLLMGSLKTLLIFFGFVFLLFMGEGSSFAEEVRGVTNDTIKIGVIIDQTGPAAFVGIPYTEAVRNYFRHINDQGGINRRKVSVLVEDDRYTIPGSIAAFKKLMYKDSALALMFLGGTGQAMALFSQVEKEKVPVMVGSLAEKMVNPFRRYIFNPGASYEDQIKVIFDYIMTDLRAKNPRIAVVYPDLEFGKIVTALETLENFDTGGISAPVTYTLTNHKAGNESKFYKGDLDKEVLIPFTGWRRPLK